jgi:hypothetical protein
MERSMMKPTVMRAVLGSMAWLLCGPLAQAGELADATVAKQLGVSGVTHTTKTNTGRGMTYSDVSYKDGEGRDLFVLRLGTPDQFNLWRQAMGTDSTPVSGVGSEAFQVRTFRAVCAKGVTAAVCVTPSMVSKGVSLSDQQIQALAAAAL